MSSVQILAFAGSTREQSFNKRLIHLGVDAARDAGAEVTLIDLRDFSMPIYDGDLEAAQGLPEGARRLKALMIEHQGFFISAPEYNSSISGVLKNAIDWVSRPQPDEPPLVAFRGKIAALMAASPSRLGGSRGLVHVRSILGNIGVLVLPNQLALSGADSAFHPDGSLKEPSLQRQVEQIAQQLASTVAKLSPDR